ncbi:MAG: DNA gyrase/topoisomerase IV subunit A, partial [Prevotellaceae bacterium]|nr:DNA gyrase/topoisomerase IV subunit A [Prevotellaceae bacterium]
STKNSQNILGDNPESRLVILTDADFPRLEIKFGGSDSFRKSLEVDAEQFIVVKSFKAKGKRLSTFNILEINELEPLRFAEKDECENMEIESDGAENFDENENEEIPEIAENQENTDTNDEYPEIQHSPIKFPKKDTLDKPQINEDEAEQTSLF